MTNQATATVITYLVYRACSPIMQNITMVIANDDRSPQLAAKAAPSAAFAFFYFDVNVEVVEIEGELVDVASGRRNVSKTYYIDAELLTREQVAALPDIPDITLMMLREMRVRGQDTIVRCRTGNIVPFDTRKDELIVTR